MSHSFAIAETDPVPRWTMLALWVLCAFCVVIALARNYLALTAPDGFFKFNLLHASLGAARRHDARRFRHFGRHRGHVPRRHHHPVGRHPPVHVSPFRTMLEVNDVRDVF